ncbi:testis-expressed protein 13A [Erinaceus europaeus]|uniref:Testis-expressed protein 13A n=1 Tax=Erinaceus europaeus TaxID=9365 RepID=A0A1S3ABA2_ERIEU|nr:testis-expressed protein 13A [Erinaceus europaeus]
MALEPEHPCGGFRHSAVVAYINKKMAVHSKGSEFYHKNISLSWEEAEDKLGSILLDSAVPSEAKEACAWGCLALGVYFARRQNQLHERRVKWLHDLAKVHKSAAQVMATDVKVVTEQQEIERREATSKLKQAQATLAEMQKERDLLRWKLFQAELSSSQATDWPGLTSAGGNWMEGTSEREVETTGAAATTTIAGPSRRARGLEGQAEGVETRKEPSGGLRKLLRSMEEKNYSSFWHREANNSSMGTNMLYSSGPLKPESTVPPAPLPVQLPASFTYSYPCIFPPLSTEPSLFPPIGTPTTASLAQMSSQEGFFDVISDVGTQGIDPLDIQRERKDSNLYQQRRPTAIRRPGDWACPWCKTVNFSQKETCYHCGKGIWLQSPQ